MTDRRLGKAYAAEESTQAVIRAYQERCAEIVQLRGTVRDPAFTNELTDENLRYVQEHGFPQVDAMSLTDITSALSTSEPNSPIMNFLEADDIAYKHLIGDQTQTYVVPNRFDNNVAHTERLDYMGTFASNSSVLAVIDGTGRQFIASNTHENRSFLEQNGYEDVGRNFPVPLSNSEIPIGIKGKGASYGVHMAVTDILGHEPLSEEQFKEMTNESCVPQPKKGHWKPVGA